MEKKNRVGADCFALKDAHEMGIMLLFHSLREGGYISQKTTEGRFLRVFTKAGTSSRIDWIGGQNELKYLILRLVEWGAVGVPRDRKWQAAANSFTIRGRAVVPDRLRMTCSVTSHRVQKRLDNILKNTVCSGRISNI